MSEPNPISRVALVFFLVVSSALAGCVEGQEAEPAQTPGSVIETPAAPQQAPIPVTNTTGAIVGSVFDEYDTPVAGANVALIGTDHVRRTNITGDFRFLDLPPASYHLRVDHEGYKAAESALRVTAGKGEQVLVRLLTQEVVPVSDRPHTHDYWAGRERVTVLDDVVPYHPQDAGGFNGAIQPVTGPANHLWTGDCLSSTDNPSPSTGAFRFEDPNQLVWPGTKSIEVTLDWTAQDYYGEKMSVIWHPANTRDYKRGLLADKRETVAIPVEAGEADLGHQLYTSWEFAVCTSEKGETISYGRPAVGNVHIKIDLVRGPTVPREPAHPDYWSNGSVLPLINETKVFDGGEAAAWLLSSRGGRADFTFIPETGTVVPPGTAELQARLSWTYDGMLDVPPVSLSYSSSTVAPWQKWMLEKRSVPESVEAGDGFRVYRIALDGSATDAVYQAISNWAFYWNFEGEERQDYALHSCACRLLVQLEVAVARAPAA